MRTLLALLRIAALGSFVVAFVAAWREFGSTGMPAQEGMTADALWWYVHQDDVRDAGLVTLVVGLVTMLVPSMLVTVAGACAVAAYASVVGASPAFDVEQPAAWWIFAGALVLVALVRRAFRRPGSSGGQATPPQHGVPPLS
ncbi:hypothetical protein KV097_08155 [Mumia sp. zg.B17]|uniref:hypothetical protein n=1 Tax=Mumia sp. zg.B17 TaxID=2855446 RepID=UPI001C6E6AE8|nr:hypothetical protein [Mumia sp. zg.B17]MBW9205917.1 hypothetical protein [Mumia sp. zg.B17]